MTTTAPIESAPPIISRRPEVCGRGRSQPQRANVPASRPTTTATTAKGIAKGLPNGGGARYVQTTLERKPVAAPASGPASAATRMVPIESR